MKNKVLAVLLAGAVGGQTAQLKADYGMDWAHYVLIKYCWTSVPSDDVKVVPQLNGDDEIIIQTEENKFKVFNPATQELSPLSAEVEIVPNQIKVTVNGKVKKGQNVNTQDAPNNIQWSDLGEGDSATFDQVVASFRKDKTAIPIKDKDKKPITIFGTVAPDNNAAITCKNGLNPAQIALEIKRPLEENKAAGQKLTWAEQAQLNNCRDTLEGVGRTRFNKLGSIALMAVALGCTYKWGHTQGYNEGIEDEDDEEDADDDA